MRKYALVVPAWTKPPLRRAVDGFQLPKSRLNAAPVSLDGSSIRSGICVDRVWCSLFFIDVHSWFGMLGERFFCNFRPPYCEARSWYL